MTVNYAPESTGIAVYTTSLAEGLAAGGMDVSVLTTVPHYPSWRVLPKCEWADARRDDGVNVVRLPAFIPRRPGQLMRGLFEISHGLRFVISPTGRRALRSADSVILLSPALFASSLVRVFMLLSRSKAKSLLWMQDRYGAGMRELAAGSPRSIASVIAGVEGILARSCDYAIVIHERWESQIRVALRLAPEKIQVIRNWSPIEAGRAVDVPATRAAFGWGPQGVETVVLHAGNMGVKQDLANVVNAARVAEQEGLPMRFVLLGAGSQEAFLREAAAGCSRVQFIAPLPDAEFASVLASADVLLVNEMPGMTETAVPSKLTSYFTVGRPVLAATDAGSVTAEEVHRSALGFLVPAGDPAALVDAVAKITSGRILATDTAHVPAANEHLARDLSRETGLRAFAELVLGDQSDLMSAGLK